MDALDRKSIPKNAIEVTPSDSENIYGEAVVLFVGNGGDIKVEMGGGQVVTFEEVQDGSYLPILVNKVYATGTTATGIVALY